MLVNLLVTFMIYMKKYLPKIFTIHHIDWNFKKTKGVVIAANIFQSQTHFPKITISQDKYSLKNCYHYSSFLLSTYILITRYIFSYSSCITFFSRNYSCFHFTISFKYGFLIFILWTLNKHRTYENLIMSSIFASQMKS